MAREITHTGASSPLNFVIRCPFLYAYVFSPNRMKISLGSGYSATQEVTISANGVTKKRNAINRVVFFDLVDIFRVPFDGSDFDLSSAEDKEPDPFYADLFNVVVTAAVGEVENVPFKLRWGAEQLHGFGLQPEWTAIKFPYWANYPLSVNPDIEIDDYTCEYTPGNLADTDTHLLNLSMQQLPTFDYVYRKLITGSIYATRKITFIKQEQTESGVFLRWVSPLGQVWHYMFKPEKRVMYELDVRNGQRSPIYPFDINDKDLGREKIISKQIGRKIRCHAAVDADIYHIVSSVVASPIVAMLNEIDDPYWLGVTISDVVLSPSTSWLKEIEFTVELSDDYIQER